MSTPVRHVTVTITEMQARTVVRLLGEGNDCLIPMSSSDIRGVRALARALRKQVAMLDIQDEEVASEA